jgi:NADH dehydrogenase FAD-containing subunit
MSRLRFLDVAIVGAGFGGLYAIHRLCDGLRCDDRGAIA